MLINFDVRLGLFEGRISFSFPKTAIFHDSLRISAIFF